MRPMHSLISGLYRGRTFALTAALMLLCAACEPAQQGAADQQVAIDLEAEKATITTMTEHYFELLEAQNFDQISGMVTEDWVSVGGVGGLQEVKEYFTHITEHEINISNIAVMVSADATLAVATCDEETRYNYDGEPRHQEATFMLTYQNGPDGWKMRLFHRSASDIADES